MIQLVAAIVISTLIVLWLLASKPPNRQMAIGRFTVFLGLFRLIAVGVGGVLFMLIPFIAAGWFIVYRAKY